MEMEMENGVIYVINDSFCTKILLMYAYSLSVTTQECVPIATSYASSALSIPIYMMTLVLYNSISISIKQ